MPCFLHLSYSSRRFDDPEPTTTPEEEAAEQLAKVRRIYIDILTGGDAALKIRDLLMTSLQTPSSSSLPKTKTKPTRC